MTLLAYFVVAAVPLGLLALLSTWMHDPEDESLFFDGRRMRWWEGGAALLVVGSVFVVLPSLVLFILFWLPVWASRTLGWIA